MSAIIIPFPSPLVAPPPADRGPFRAVVREGDEVWCARTRARLGPVVALIGDRLVYRARWGAPRTIALGDVLTAGELPWIDRP